MGKIDPVDQEPWKGPENKDLLIPATQDRRNLRPDKDRGSATAGGSSKWPKKRDLVTKRPHRRRDEGVSEKM